MREVISEATIQVLKNFASINSNIVIENGSSIRTISEAKNILAKAEVEQTFPQRFGIYDLSEFLGVLGLVDTPVLDFAGDYVTIGDSTGRSNIKYFFSDPDMLTTSTKDVKMPEGDVKFRLDMDTLNKLKRAAAALGHSELIIESSENAGLAKLTVTTTDNSTANTFSIDIPVEENSSSYKFVYNINNLKILTGNYDVEISSKLISKLTNAETKLQYWIALEKTSTYGE